jgi:hypothetical protein
VTNERSSEIHGRGLFATQDLPAGAVVAVKGGHLLDGAQVTALGTSLRHAELQVGDDLFVGPVDEVGVEQSLLYINHSCDPTTYVRGDITVVTRGPVPAGGELTVDYGSVYTRMEPIDCRCGTALCRGTVTGTDWQLSELRARYGDQFPSYLLAKFTHRVPSQR